jgi:hypothetical protein
MCEKRINNETELTNTMRKKMNDIGEKIDNPLIANIIRGIKAREKKQLKIVVPASDEKVRSKVEKFLHDNRITFEIKGLPKTPQIDPALKQALENYKNLTGVEFKSQKNETVAIKNGDMTRLDAVLNRTKMVRDVLDAN